MRLQTIYFLLLISFYSDAQPPTIEWQKCYGGTNFEVGRCIRQTHDNRFLIAGNTTSNDGDVSGNHSNFNDYWVIKIDSTGLLQWQKCYGGSDDEVLSSCEVTIDNGFILAGYSGSNNGDVTGNHLGVDYWIVRCDSNGNILWQKSFGGSGSDEAYKVLCNGDSGYFVVGSSNSTDYEVTGSHLSGLCSSCDDAWFIKLDTSGTIISSKCFGGSYGDRGNSIVQIGESSFVIAGTSQSNDGDVSGNRSPTYAGDYWIFKIDSSYNVTNQKCFGGTQDDNLYSAIQTLDLGYLLIGRTHSNDSDVVGNHDPATEDLWIVKVDSLFNVEWKKCLGGSMYEFGSDALQLIDTSYLILAHTSSQDGDVMGNHGFASDAWLLNVDKNGTLLWQKCFGGSSEEQAFDIQPTRDSGYIFTGTTLSNDGDVSGNHGNFDIWVVKLSPLSNSASEKNPITDFSTHFNIESSDLHLNFHANGNENIQMKLLDITGRIILQQKVVASPGFNEQKIHVGQHANGVYLVELETGNGSATKKVLMN